jgi:hypothetical protein
MPWPIYPEKKPLVHTGLEAVWAPEPLDITEIWPTEVYICKILINKLNAGDADTGAVFKTALDIYGILLTPAFIGEMMEQLVSCATYTAESVITIPH